LYSIRASADYLDDPYPTYKVLRDHHPAYFLAEHRLWLITRSRRRAGPRLTNPAVWSSSRGNVVIDAAVRVGRTLGTLDPPRHDELRAVVNKGRVASSGAGRLLAEKPVSKLASALPPSLIAVGGDIIGDFGRPILNRTPRPFSSVWMPRIARRGAPPG